MPFALLITLCVALGPGLSSCSSNSKPKKNSPAAANYADMKLEQRITYQIRNRDKVQTGLAKKAYNAGKEVESGNFKTKEFAGSKMFHNKKFKTDTYAQADKKSGFLNKMFQGHDKENAMADDQFKSPLNRYGDKKPWDYDKRSKAEGDVFTTRSEPEALKKQEKNIRPLILEDSQNSGYTEFDIQKLLKKD
ncbi:hypothetical protein [Roseimicrobium gellanilyticum]|nr:hypothetical protein [Roseimicrobium gellanilyticum]